MSATAAIVGAAQAMGSGLTSIINTNKTIKAQRKLAEYSYSKDLEMWNKANEYNSPTAQMERLKNAGLNPHLVYGNGSVTGNTTTQTPKYQQYSPEYKYEAPQIAGALAVLGAYQDYQNKKALNEGIMLDNVDKSNRNLVSSEMWSEKLNQLSWSAFRNKQEGIIRQNYAANAPQMFDIDRTRQLNALALQSAQVKSLMANTEARQIENRLLGLGLRGSDPAWIRLLIQNTTIPDKLKSLFGKSGLGR